MRTCYYTEVGRGYNTYMLLHGGVQRYNTYMLLHGGVRKV